MSFCRSSQYMDGRAAMLTLSRFCGVVLLLLSLVTLQACSLAKGSTTPSVPPLALGPTATVPAGLELRITSPLDGAQLPEGAPIEIQFTASGGPFLQAGLLIDGTAANTLPITSQEPQYSGVLYWESPFPGSHQLVIQVTTAENQIATAEVSVQVGTVGPASPTPPAPPAVETTFVPTCILGAPTPTPPPAVVCETTSIGDTATPTPALMDRETAKRRIIELYHEEFGLDLTAPTLAKMEALCGSDDPWVSVAYVGDLLYEIDLYLDGHAESFLTPLGHGINGIRAPATPTPVGSEPLFMGPPVCPPAGTYSMLVVFVDYGNLGITREEALSALQQATEAANATYAHLSAAAGLSSPILQLETTGWFVSPPPAMPTYLLTPDLIRSITGMDLQEFDWLAQVDLDACNTAQQYFHSRDQSSPVLLGGFASPSCGAPAKELNIWATLDEKNQLYGEKSPLLIVLLSHEVLHLLGYPGSHIWPCGDGITHTRGLCDIRNVPTLLLGWTDTDGDGTVEILDRTPYGIVVP